MVKGLEERHKQSTQAAHQKSVEALGVEFTRGKEVRKWAESIMNEAKTKEEDNKEHQQEIAL